WPCSTGSPPTTILFPEIAADQIVRYVMGVFQAVSSDPGLPNAIASNAAKSAVVLVAHVAALQVVTSIPVSMPAMLVMFGAGPKSRIFSRGKDKEAFADTGSPFPWSVPAAV